MGQISYGPAYEAEFDDRLLTHLQLVITAKLRRGDSFSFTWANDQRHGSGRTTLWLHQAIPLIFTFNGATPSINREWIDILMTSANSPGGLRVIPEPVDTDAIADAVNPKRASVRAS